MATQSVVTNFRRIRTEPGRFPRQALVNVNPWFHGVAREIGTISGGWNPVEMYTAKNMLAEKAAFLEAFDRGVVYHPRFVYNETGDTEPSRRQLQKLKDELERFSVQNDPVGMLVRAALIEQVLNDLHICGLADGLSGRSHNGMSGEQLICAALAQMYQPLDQELLTFAEYDCTLRSCPGTSFGNRPGRLTEAQKRYLNERSMTAEETKAAFEWALAQYNLLWRKPGDTGFRVIIDPEATAIDVRHRSLMGPVVVIPPNENRLEALTARDLVMLIRHEIEGHARQSRNGHLVFGYWGGNVTGADETLYEGLAMYLESTYLEELYGSEEQVRTYPYTYVTAVNVAMNGGTFHDVFVDQLIRYLRTELKIVQPQDVPGKEKIAPEVWKAAKGAAWRAAYRVMRGHLDCSNPMGFAMTKDLAYARGEIIHRGLVECGSGQWNEMGILSGEQALYDLARFDLEPDDVPLKDMRVTDRYLPVILADMPA